MTGAIRIVSVTLDGDYGLVVSLSDNTTTAYVIEELLELRPNREPTPLQRRAVVTPIKATLLQQHENN
jgi:hypothetical protein